MRMRGRWRDQRSATRPRPRRCRCCIRPICCASRSHKRLAWRDLRLLRRALDGKRTGARRPPLAELDPSIPLVGSAGRAAAEDTTDALGRFPHLRQCRGPARPGRWRRRLRHPDPGGGGGLGIGAMIVLGLIGWALGIDPRILISGAEMVTGGGGSRLRAAGARAAAPQPAAARRRDQIGPLRGRRSSAIPRTSGRRSCPPQANRQYAPAPLVLFTRRHALRLRRGAIGHGAVLLPARPQGLSRHVLLPGDAAQVRRRRRLRLRLRDRARGRPPRPEPARHPAARCRARQQRGRTSARRTSSPSASS